jgi:hypothetical protein
MSADNWQPNALAGKFTTACPRTFPIHNDAFVVYSSMDSTWLWPWYSLGIALTSRSEPKTVCLDLDQLQRMCPDQLDALYRQSEVGKPLVGVANGRLLYLTDKRLPKLKVKLANAVKAKAARTATSSIAGSANQLDRFDVRDRPSWVDGKSPSSWNTLGTLFANMHDELRAKRRDSTWGRFERCPCPKFRGYVALQLITCCEEAPTVPPPAPGTRTAEPPRLKSLPTRRANQQSEMSTTILSPVETIYA